MAETRSTTVATQEALASLRTASDHHGKEIQEMQDPRSAYTYYERDESTTSNPGTKA